MNYDDLSDPPTSNIIVRILQSPSSHPGVSCVISPALCVSCPSLPVCESVFLQGGAVWLYTFFVSASPAYSLKEPGRSVLFEELYVASCGDALDQFLREFCPGDMFADL